MANKTITALENGYYGIIITFAASELKDGETLSGETRIRGTEAQANDYATVFEADLRREYADKFPVPEIPADGMAGMIDTTGGM